MQNNSKNIFSHRGFNEIINKSKGLIPEEEENEVLAADKYDGMARFWSIENTKQIIKLRRKYSDKIYALNLFWLGFVAITIILSAIKCICLSDKVLITLLTTTTANIIGTLIIFLKYLFPNKK